MTKSPSVRTAVIGVGYLGKFHAEKYAAIEGCELVAVADTNISQATQVAENLGAKAVANYRELLDQVDAVSIVTPTSIHYETALAFLNQGIHVLVEKPITTTVTEAQQLIDAAQANHCILQVGHLERFNAAMLDLDRVLTTPKFIETHRLAPYKPRATDVDVILDLMIHDIDIILSIAHSDLVGIAVSGTSVLSDQTDIANARLTFANGCVANVTASRISLKTERKMRIFQTDAYISIDFQNRIFSYHRKGKGEMFPGVPNIDSKETVYDDGDALLAEIADFIKCIRHQTAPLVSGQEGLKALQTAIQIRELLNRPEGS